ncbi:MAG: Membrane-bound lytic murein transglycosylase precursor [Mycobacterium sp.]|jgi:cell wall-associated NlpC family hydrolase|nr:Membrane-bound lytic murein transglycosylase precursor [Mycobacterium sp.]
MTISSIRDLASAAPTAPAAPAAPAPAGMAAVQARIQALQQKLGYTSFAGALGQATAAANPAGSTLGALGAATAAGAGGASVADAVIADAKSYLGTPYVWGGAAPGGFDCSGLVQYVYGKQGVSLPRTSQEQQNAGTSVTAAQAQPGDLVFFGTPAYHEGIYLGNGQMLEAPHTGANVRISAVDLSTVSSIRRVIPQPATATAASVTGGSTTWAAGLPAAAQKYVPQIQAAADRNGVDPRLLASLVWQESGFNPSAGSPAGAQGLVQLMPATAAGLGVNPLDPAQALDGGARYLKSQLTSFGGRPDLALAAYNAGPTAVRNAGGVPPYAETQNYVATVLGHYRALGGTA